MNTDREFINELQTAPITLPDIPDPLQGPGLRADHAQKGAFVSFGSEFSQQPFPEKPQQLPAKLAEVPEFDLELLPERLRGFVNDVSERMQVPQDFIAVGCLVCLGAVIGRRLGIYPKRYDDWLVVPNLWGCIVSDPSKMKTPALQEVLNFLYQLESVASTEHAATDTFDNEMLVYNAQYQAFNDQLKTAAKKGNTPDMQAIQSRLSALTKPEKTEPARFLVGDSTVEKLGMLINQNPNGLLVVRDELTGWLYTLDKQGREGDRQFFLEAWNGKNRFNVERIGRGSLHIDALCISVLGTVQPGPLSTYVKQALNSGRGADGFMQRFQLGVWPDDTGGVWQNIDRYPDHAAKDAVRSVFTELSCLPVPISGAEVPGGSGPQVKDNFLLN